MRKQERQKENEAEREERGEAIRKDPMMGGEYGRDLGSIPTPI